MITNKHTHSQTYELTNLCVDTFKYSFQVIKQIVARIGSMGLVADFRLRIFGVLLTCFCVRRHYAQSFPLRRNFYTVLIYVNLMFFLFEQCIRLLCLFYALIQFSYVTSMCVCAYLVSRVFRHSRSVTLTFIKNSHSASSLFGPIARQSPFFHIYL